MKNIFTFLFILFTINVAGQNLVVNPSFELYNPCPTGTSQINNATGWTATNYSPEFYHACATQASQVSIPTNVCGYQYPATGNGCMAALCYGSFASNLIANLREYSTGTLTQPLVVGNNYHVSLKVVLMNAASHSCDHIGALFTVGYKATQSITNFAHVYGTTQISDTLNWTEISGTFVADSAYTHIVIGNLFDDNNTNVTSLQPVTFGWNGYYFIDDIEVRLASAQFANTCYGDSTVFTNIVGPNVIATSWNFGDPNSGLNNDVYTTNATHLFTDTGTYLVTTVNYNNLGFSDTLYTTVTISNPPVFNLGNDTTLCNGTILNLGIAATNATLLWSTGDTIANIAVSTAGTYWLNASDNGCNNSDTIVVNYTTCAVPQVNISSSDTVFCEKQAIDFFDLSANNPTSWQWYFTGAQPATSTVQNPAGIYYPSYGSFDVKLVACNAAGCDSITYSQFVTELQNPPAPVVTVTGSLLCSSPAANYAWYETSNLTQVLATTQCFQPLVTGSYFVIVFDSSGCNTPSQSVVVTGVNEYLSNDCVLYSANQTIQFNNDCLKDWDSQLRIFDSQGRIVFSTEINRNEIRLPHLSKGIYYYDITSSKKVMHGKLMIQQ